MARFTEHEEELIKGSINRLIPKYKQEEFIRSFNGRLTGRAGLTRWLGKHDIQFFAKYYLPDKFACDFGEHHYDMFSKIKLALNGDKGYRKQFFLCFREAAKSTIGNTLVGCHQLLYGSKVYLVEVCSTSDFASGFIENIKDVMTSTDFHNLRRDFGILKGSKWNSSDIVLNNGNAASARGFFATDMRGINYKNRRPSLVIFDDVESARTSGTIDLMNKAKELMKASHLNVGKGDETVYLMLCTIPKEDSLTYDMVHTPSWGFEVTQYPAIQKWSEHPELWQEWENILNPKDMDTSKVYSVKERQDKALAFYNLHKQEMIEGTKVTWEAYKPYYKLMEKKVEIGLRAFMKEYQHDLSMGEDKIFSTLVRYNELEQSYIDSLYKVMFLDPSEGHPNGDYSAVTVLGYDKKSGLFYLLYGDICRKKPSILNEELKSLIIGKYPDLKAVYYETNGGEFRYDEFVKLMKDTTFSKSKIKPYLQKNNKHDRIVDMQPIIDNGVIRFPQQSTPYTQQVLDYSKSATHDDAPDSLQGCYKVIQEQFKKQLKIV